MEKANDVEHTVIAFYGLQRRPDFLEVFYQSALRWFAKLGLEPDLAGWGFSKKLVAFPRMRKKISTSGLAAVEHLGLYSLPPGCASVWDASCFEACTNATEGECVVCSRSSLLNFGTDTLRTIANDVLSAFHPAYGIGYTRTFSRGPSLYAMGLCRGDAPEEEKLRISRWGLTGLRDRVYAQGLLRDVYPWNFLTAPQLLSKVGTLDLRRWIEEDASRGSLSKLTDHHSLWVVDDNELPVVRNALWDAGRIFDYDRYRAERQKGPPASEAEVLSALLGADPNTGQILKVKKGGQLEEVSPEGLKRTLKKGRRKTAKE